MLNPLFADSHHAEIPRDICRGELALLTLPVLNKSTRHTAPRKTLLSLHLGRDKKCMWTVRVKRRMNYSCILDKFVSPVLYNRDSEFGDHYIVACRDVA